MCRRSEFMCAVLLGLLLIIPGQSQALMDLHLMGFFPMTGQLWPGGQALLPATEMAIRDVNSRADILSDYTLKFVWLDTQCHAGLSINAMYELLYSPPVKHMIIGPACSTEAEVQAQASYMWNISHFSYGASSPILSDKNVYPKFYRTITPDTINNMAKIALIRHFGWTKVATINVALNKFSAVINDFVQRVKGTEITIISQEIFDHDPLLRIQNLKKKDARIIIAEGYTDSGRSILCAAYKVGLYGPKIVWIFPGLYQGQEYWWRSTIENLPCTAKEMDEAAEGHFITTSYKRNPDNKRGVAGMTVTEFDARLRQEPSYTPGSPESDYMAPLMYDTLWASALSLNCTDAEMKSLGYSKTLDQFDYSDGDIGNIMTSCMHNVSFLGLSGMVKFDKGGEPLKNIEIIQLKDLEKVTVCMYVIEEEPYHLEWLNGGITWRGGVAPRDSTQITEVEVTIPEYLYIIVSCLASGGILLAVLLFIFNVVYRNHVYIKLSSPNINNILLLGCVLSYSTVFMYNSHNDEQNIMHCKMRHFTFTMGFTMAFGAMFSKMWRVYKIFCNKKLLRIKLMDFQLIVIVVILEGVMLAILLLWEIIDPLYTWKRYLDNQYFTVGNDAEVHPFIRDCTSNYYNHFLWTICILEGVLLTFGAFLSFETRKVKLEALNDSQHIAMCLYNVIILSALGLILSQLLNNQMALLYGIVCGFIILGTTATQLIVFLPKIHSVFYPNTVDTAGTQPNVGVSSSQPVTMLTRLTGRGPTI